MLDPEHAHRLSLIVQDEYIKRFDPTLKALPVEITCEVCPSNDNCRFAFDLYNTYRDCLAEK